ncbi:glycosyltransferase [Providencia rettgeri]|nr:MULTISPECIES: glycosyltransferase [Providencia]EIU7556050.1 glycosyltransferase [Providencia rettgeri]MCB4840377.1 glycosyltransferase [Providencia rettgeri]MCG5277708.1 glycosyltransferase [Providencia rettgeri]
MKVLHLSKYYKPFSGGIEQVVADLCEGGNSQNIKSDVLAINHEKKNKNYTINGVDVFSFKSNLKYASADISINYIIKLRDIIQDYDIIHIHLPNPLANLAIFLANSKNVKIVIHWHSDIVKQKKLKFFYKPLQSWLLKKACSIITTTPVYGDCSKDLLNYKNKITTIPIGINPHNYSINTEIISSIKAKYLNKKIIFSLGRLVYYKGFEYLVEACAKLPDNYVVLLGGNGEEKLKLIQKIKLLNLQDKFILLGFIKDTDLPSYFAACDAFCLPSIEKSEAFGVVQLESFLFNKPVVSCNIPGSGVSWVNQDNISGITVEPKNSDKLASALLTVTQDTTSFPNLKAYFNENFSADVMVSRTIRLYSELNKPNHNVKE